MKIGAIRRLVKEAGCCVILDVSGRRQWIGTMGCCYPVDDGIQISKISVAGLLDLDEKEQKRIAIYEERPGTMAAYPEKIEMGEMEVFPITVTAGEEYQPLQYDGITYFVPMKKIKAAVDNGDYRRYLLGRNSAGQPVIAVEDGMILAGTMLPERAEKVEALQKVMRQLCFGRAGGWEEEKKEEETEGEQMEMDET